jgi:hypothetical protein
MSLRSKAKFWLRQFPFIYPRKIIHSCRDWIDNRRKHGGIYFNQRGPWYKPILSGGSVHLDEPNTVGPPNKKGFDYNRNYTFDPALLFYLPNSYVYGNKGIVLTARHYIFEEFTHHFGISSLGKFLRRNLFYTFTKNFKKVAGTGAVLVSPQSHNYYHWLNDVLPRIRLYEPVLNSVDYFCISSAVPAKFLEVLPAFGIDPKKVLLIGEKEKLHFDHLYVASLPGSEGRSPDWASDFIREKLLKKPPPAPTKKLYFKRGNSGDRKVLNEDSIISILRDREFDIIDPGPLTIHEQIDLVQSAKMVIGAHSAALSNLLFAGERTVVIEIFSPDYFRTDCYYTLSSSLRLNYWYMAGNKPDGANWGDIVVDEDLLIKTIETADAR